MLSITAIFQNGITSIVADEKYISAAKPIEYLGSGLFPEQGNCLTADVIEKVIAELSVLAQDAC